MSTAVKNSELNFSTELINLDPSYFYISSAEQTIDDNDDQLPNIDFSMSSQIHPPPFTYDEIRTDNEGSGFNWYPETTQMVPIKLEVEETSSSSSSSSQLVPVKIEKIKTENVKHTTIKPMLDDRYTSVLSSQTSTSSSSSSSPSSYSTKRPSFKISRVPKKTGVVSIELDIKKVQEDFARMSTTQLNLFEQLSNEFPNSFGVVYRVGNFEEIPSDVKEEKSPIREIKKQRISNDNREATNVKVMKNFIRRYSDDEIYKIRDTYSISMIRESTNDIFKQLFIEENGFMMNIIDHAESRIHDSVSDDYNLYSYFMTHNESSVSHKCGSRLCVPVSPRNTIEKGKVVFFKIDHFNTLPQPIFDHIQNLARLYFVAANINPCLAGFDSADKSKFGIQIQLIFRKDLSKRWASLRTLTGTSHFVRYFSHKDLKYHDRKHYPSIRYPNTLGQLSPDSSVHLIPDQTFFINSGCEIHNGNPMKRLMRKSHTKELYTPKCSFTSSTLMDCLMIFSIQMNNNLSNIISIDE